MLLAFLWTALLVQAIPLQQHAATVVAAKASEHISSWTLNAGGTAAVCRTGARSRPSLHALAINSHRPIPATRIGSTHTDALYTFINNSTLITFAPSFDVRGSWSLTSRQIDFSVSDGAAPPSAGSEVELDNVHVEGTPRNLIYAEALGMLIVLEDEHVGVSGVRVRWWDMFLEGFTGAPEGLGDLLIEEMVTNGTHLVFTAHHESPHSSFARTSSLYTYNLLTSSLNQISRSRGSFASSPVISSRGTIAWLEEPEAGSDRQRELWLHDEETWKVDLDFEHDPSRCLFWSDGSAIALIAQEDTKHSLFEFWTPIDPTFRVRPVRIYSGHNVRSVAHVAASVNRPKQARYVAVLGDEQGEESVWAVTRERWNRPKSKHRSIRLTTV